MNEQTYLWIDHTSGEVFLRTFELREMNRLSGYDSVCALGWGRASSMSMPIDKRVPPWFTTIQVVQAEGWRLHLS